MNDSPLARWTVLVLVALMMFFAYMFVDVMSPLKSLVESNLGWNSSVFGTYAASEFILNVCGFLIIAGVILDKLGVRFSGVLSAAIMVVGAAIKFVGVSDWFQTTGFCNWLNRVGSSRSSRFHCSKVVFTCGLCFSNDRAKALE